MLGKRRLTVATVAVFAGATWAVFVSPGSNVAAAPAMGDTVRASLYDGGPPNEAEDGGNQSRVSGNGRYDVFVSTDPLDPNISTRFEHAGVFVRDLKTDRTTQISVARDEGGLTGDGGNEDSGSPDISADGRYVSFVTAADNIAPGAPDGGDELVVVCDRDPDGDGRFDEPVSATDAQADIQCVGIGEFGQINSTPKLSGDGSILVWGIPGNQDNTFDRVEVAKVLDNSGDLIAYPDTAELSSDPESTNYVDTGLGDFTNFDDPVVSADGQHVVYSGVQAFGEPDLSGIFDTTLDADGVPGSTTRRDTDPNNNPNDFIGSDGDHEVRTPAVSGDGAVVAYVADVIGGSTTPQIDVSQRFRTTYPITQKPTGEGNTSVGGDGIEPTLSADGRYAAFVTDQADMVDATRPTGLRPEVTCIDIEGGNLTANNVPCQVVVRDLVDYSNAYFGGDPKGIGFAQLASASVSNDCGAPSGAVCDGDYDSTNPSLSDHGAQVGFDSFADDLVRDDTNVICDFSCTEGYSDGSPAEDAFARTWNRSVKSKSRDLGSVHVGSGKTARYKITGTGFGGQVITAATITPLQGDGLTIDDTGCGGGSNAPFVLYQGESCFVTIIFAPTAVGPVRGQVQVSSDGNPPADPAVITGTALPPLPTNTRDIVRTSVGDGDPGTQGDRGTECFGSFRTCEGSSMVSGDGRYDVFVSRDPLDGRPTRGTPNLDAMSSCGTCGPTRPSGSPGVGRGSAAGHTCPTATSRTATAASRRSPRTAGWSCSQPTRPTWRATSATTATWSCCAIATRTATAPSTNCRAATRPNPTTAASGSPPPTSTTTRAPGSPRTARTSCSSVAPSVPRPVPASTPMAASN